jgi:hypothetical protein
VHAGICRRSSLRAAVGLAIGLVPAWTAAQDAGAPRAEPAKKHYRWGVGWDEGLALRARFANGWGLGLRLNPDLADPESTTSESYDGSQDVGCAATDLCWDRRDGTSHSKATGKRRAFATAVTLSHERTLRRGLAVGPYLTVSYERLRETAIEETEGDGGWSGLEPLLDAVPMSQGQQRTSSTNATRWQRTLALELGVRPVFQIHERLLLETRFGLELAFTKWSENSSSSAEDWSDPEPRLMSSSYWSPTVSASDTRSARKGSERRLRAVGERLGPGAELRFVVLF